MSRERQLDVVRNTKRLRQIAADIYNKAFVSRWRPCSELPKAPGVYQRRGIEGIDLVGFDPTRPQFSEWDGKVWAGWQPSKEKARTSPCRRANWQHGEWLDESSNAAQECNCGGFEPHGVCCNITLSQRGSKLSIRPENIPGNSLRSQDVKPADSHPTLAELRADCRKLIGSYTRVAKFGERN